jgi:hypothetical protein
MIFAAWIVAVILFLILVALIENGQLGWSIGVVAAVVLLVAYGTGVTIALAWTFFTAHPIALLIGAVGYFAVGAAWSVIKWWAFVRKLFRRIAGGEQVFDVNDGYDRRKLGPENPPKVANHKEDITTWMSFWPISMAWTIVDDPVRRICTEIYHSLSGFLQGIADKQFNKLNPNREAGE